jgi:hypothetical protein
MKHRYLFILEVAPVATGKTYDELPSHLTLMSRFFSQLTPAQLTKVVHSLFEQTAPFGLTFGATTELGPKKLRVHMMEHSDILHQLHDKLRDLLDSIAVDYEYPQFIGKSHKPHVTKREDVQYNIGDRLIVKTACLVEVVDRRRVIRSNFALHG